MIAGLGYHVWMKNRLDEHHTLDAMTRIPFCEPVSN